MISLKNNNVVAEMVRLLNSSQVIDVVDGHQHSTTDEDFYDEVRLTLSNGYTIVLAPWRGRIDEENNIEITLYNDQGIQFNRVAGTYLKMG